MSVTAGSPCSKERVSARCAWVKYKPCSLLTPRQLSETTASLLARQHLPLLVHGADMPLPLHPLNSRCWVNPHGDKHFPHPHQTILSSPGVSVSTEEPELSGYSASLVQQQTSHPQRQPIQMAEENRESKSPLSGTNVPAGS